MWYAIVAVVSFFAGRLYQRSKTVRNVVTKAGQAVEDKAKAEAEKIAK